MEIMEENKNKLIKMRTTIPTEIKVLMNHIYELHKGVRQMVLFTCNKKYGEQTIKRLESQGIPYLLQPAGRQNLNVYFGRRECLEAIRLIVTRPLNQLTPEEDFILGVTGRKAELYAVPLFFIADSEPFLVKVNPD